ncbi:MAG: regulatory protein RecX [Nitrospina sp.]|jgi:regulatory protein|nr:regulatory protein RecX [Nitrospina sp.]
MPDPESLKRAKSHALRYLSYRDRSKWEITEHLKKKEHPHPVIQQTLDYLTELNYLNDQRFALQWGQYKINKKKLGKNRLYVELLNKGIDKEILENTINTLYEDNPEIELAAQCARKKWNTLKGVEEEKKKRRLVQYLQRRGFSADIIYNSLGKLIDSNPLEAENYFPQPSSPLDQD